MRIKQYAYFSIGSDRVTAVELERIVGLQPDCVSVRGNRRASPPLPASHVWRVRYEEPGLTVEEQVAQVVARLAPYRPAIRKVLREHDDVCGGLQVVRYFGAFLADDEGEEEDLTAGPDGLEHIPGQHQLLGWHPTREVMEFLLDVGTEIDFDEYG